MNQMKALFYNPKLGLNSINKFKAKLQHEGVKFTPKQLSEFYSKQHVNQVLKRITKPKQFSSIWAESPYQFVQMDLIVYNRYKYHNYQYIFVLVDTYSRYAYARALTNRNIETLFEAFSSIIKEMGSNPENVQCDNEFNTHLFNTYFQEHNITARFSHPDEMHKNAIVERLNATIAQMLQKVRITTKNYDWKSYLQDVMYNYNHTIHSTLGQTPFDMLFHKASSKQKLIYVDNPFNVNDKVRIIRKKRVFAKSDELKLSKEVYLVTSVDGNKVYLESIKKAYKPYELERVYDTEEVEEAVTVEEPQTQTRENRRTQLLKREGIDYTNIITGKRDRKPVKLTN